LFLSAKNRQKLRYTTRQERHKLTALAAYGLLRVRGIYPTDIDGLIDYGGRSFVYMEGKTITAQLKKGQKMALENIVNSHNKAGHTSVAIIYRHNTRVSEDIQVKSCFVSAVF